MDDIDIIYQKNPRGFISIESKSLRDDNKSLHFKAKKKINCR